MTILEFPAVDNADEHGLLGVGGDLEVDSLLLAYRSGIFPWPLSVEYLTWFAPPVRAILCTSDFHESRSLRRSRNRNWASFAIDVDFEQVITRCQELTNRVGQNGTWITPDMKAAYIEMHRAGHAHSFECYREGELVGGLYGVYVDGIFAAESMFYRFPDASKLALWFMIDYLKTCGIHWCDVQILTPLLQRLGAKEITRQEFMKLLKQQQKKSYHAFEDCSAEYLARVLPDWYGAKSSE